MAKVITHMEKECVVKSSIITRRKFTELLAWIEEGVASMIESHLDVFIMGVCLAATVYLLYHIVNFIH